MSKCPFCKAETPDLGTHCGRECQNVAEAFGPGETVPRSRVRAYPLPDEYEAGGEYGHGQTGAAKRAKARQWKAQHGQRVARIAAVHRGRPGG